MFTNETGARCISTTIVILSNRINYYEQNQAAG